MRVNTQFAGRYYQWFSLQMGCDHCLVPRWHVWCVVTCWVHVLSGDHRCPRKSVLLRRNSNTSHMRLHLDSVCGAVCKMPASLNTGSLGRECERSCSIPRLPGGHFRLRVNMVIVWGEEREMREERREWWDQQWRGENYCSRGWLLLQNIKPSLLVLIIRRFTVREIWCLDPKSLNIERCDLRFVQCHKIMLPAVLCWLALLSPLKWEWDDQHSWHCAPELPAPAQTQAASEQLKLSQDLIVLDTAQPVQREAGAGLWY